MNNNKSRIACITGGTKGIGAATVKKFLTEDYHVVFCSRNQRDLDSSKIFLSQFFKSNHIHPLKADMGNYSEISSLFSYIQTTFGHLDCLINNAAIIDVKSLEESTLSDIQNQFNINVFGVIQAIKSALPLLKKQGGSIVNISSLSGIKGVEKFPGFCGYTMTKSAIVGLTENLAVELKPHNIRVNCVAPGAVATDMLSYAAPQLKTSTLPEDIANSIYFLSDETVSSSLSGTILEVHSNE